MKILAISGSLHPQSRSLVLARYFVGLLAGKRVESELIDLRQHDLPLHTGTSASRTDTALKLTE